MMDEGGSEDLRLEADRLREALAHCEAERERDRQSARVLAQLHAHVKDFAVIILSPDGRVGMWNEGAERLFGYGAEQITGQTGALLFTPEDRAAGRQQAELAQAASEGRADDDCWLQRKDGSRFWASGVTTAIRGEGGHLEGFVKILRDHTSRKVVEDELQRLNATLDERVRERTSDLEEALREMGAFAYSIAHDLRAPLRAMSGFSRLLAEDHSARLDDSGREMLGRISSAAVRMDHMIEDLLAYSRLTRTEITCRPLDPRRVVEEVLSDLSAVIADRGADIGVEGEFPAVLGHEVTLRQVFTNLIGNAIKFARPGDRPVVRIRAERREDWIRLWVEDNGIGIPVEYHGKIFGIFERLHPAGDYPGTGIGLAIVNRAMERMKGKVGVESEPGRGSRFWIELRRPFS
ncbi:MAG TPA: ATP-binding protein [Planctomycetota bacterium]|nr:ATP-binding protein [Planctomycetota bacterium]